MAKQHRSRQGPGNDVVALLKQVSDLKEAARVRRRVEDALRESEALLRRAFEEAPAALGVFDQDGRLVLANAALARRLGYGSLEELRALAELSDLFLDLDAEHLFGAAGGGDTREVEIRCRRGDGQVESVPCRVGLPRRMDPGGTVWFSERTGAGERH
jgi:PAS domain S-box-containing protein